MIANKDKLEHPNYFQRARTDPFLFLFVSLIGTYALSPLIKPGQMLLQILNSLLILCVLAFGVRAAASERIGALMVSALAAPVFVIHLTSFEYSGLLLIVAGHAFAILFLGYVGVTILGHVLQAGRVTSEKIHAAACVYLLVAYTWAYVFALIECVTPGSFDFLAAAYAASDGSAAASFPSQEFSQLVYFSFVTITTLGYGDVTPIAPLPRVLATIEALIGQFYIAILLARLVALQIAHSAETK